MLLIGLDEAGYGPNLGPLVVAATVWETPDGPSGAPFDLWTAFAGVVSRRADAGGGTVHVADSKTVHSSAAGIAAVERSARTILELAGVEAPSLFGLWDGLTGDDGRAACGEPWFLDGDLPLPLAADPADVSAVAGRWAERCRSLDCRVRVAAAVVPAAAFNAGVARSGSKGRLLSQTTFALLRRVWDGAAPALVVCDKHGGRDRYADLLTEAFPETFPLCLEESRFRSRYRLGAGEVRVQPKAEEHLPVAAASLAAKYLREATMAAFNRHWLARLPGLKPTAGYPVDARRFLAAIEADAAAQGLPSDRYWRCR